MLSYIYVIAANDAGPVKIGLSRQPERRVRQLQTGHSETLKLHYTEAVEIEKVLVLEQLIHRANRHLTIRGEWFDLTVEQAIAEVQFCLIRYDEVPELARMVRAGLR